MFPGASRWPPQSVQPLYAARCQFYVLTQHGELGGRRHRRADVGDPSAASTPAIPNTPTSWLGAPGPAGASAPFASVAGDSEPARHPGAYNGNLRLGDRPASGVAAVGYTPSCPAGDIDVAVPQNVTHGCPAHGSPALRAIDQCRCCGQRTRRRRLPAGILLVSPWRVALPAPQSRRPLCGERLVVTSVSPSASAIGPRSRRYSSRGITEGLLARPFRFASNSAILLRVRLRPSRCRRHVAAVVRLTPPLGSRYSAVARSTLALRLTSPACVPPGRQSPLTFLGAGDSERRLSAARLLCGITSSLSSGRWSALRLVALLHFTSACRRTCVARHRASSGLCSPTAVQPCGSPRDFAWYGALCCLRSGSNHRKWASPRAAWCTRLFPPFSQWLHGSARIGGWWRRRITSRCCGPARVAS